MRPIAYILRCPSTPINCGTLAMSDNPFSPSVEEALSLAIAAGAGNLAAAAAQRTSVPDTLSALLGHELAVGHRLMMRLAAEVDGMIGGIAGRGGDGRAALEAARLAGVVARLMERYRVGVMALHKLRGKDGVGETIVRLAWGIPDDDKSGGSGSGSGTGGASAGGSGPAASGDPGADLAPAAAAPAGRGRLRNGNPSGDYAAAPRCGARTRSGAACRQPAMANGRCRFHGGHAAGPVTPEGRERARRARLRHGARRAGVLALRSEAAAAGRRLAALLDAAGGAALGGRPAGAPAGHGVDRSDSGPRSPAAPPGGSSASAAALGGEAQRGRHVLGLQVGIVGPDLLPRGAGRQQLEVVHDPDAQAAATGPAAALARLAGDPAQVARAHRLAGLPPSVPLRPPRRCRSAGAAIAPPRSLGHLSPPALAAIRPPFVPRQP
jgi:hypothetical protein